MCDMSNRPEVKCSTLTDAVFQRGDLLVCASHATLLPASVGRVEGETRCHCGYFKPVGTPCGEPCM